MKDLRLKFKGIDDWNRPVFMDDNGRYFGDTDHLFDYTASKDDVLNFYRNMPLNNCICYFGQQFGCEPMGIEIKSNVKIILELAGILVKDKTKSPNFSSKDSNLIGDFIVVTIP